MPPKYHPFRGTVCFVRPLRDNIGCHIGYCAYFQASKGRPIMTSGADPEIDPRRRNPDESACASSHTDCIRSLF